MLIIKLFQYNDVNSTIITLWPLKAPSWAHSNAGIEASLSAMWHHVNFFFCLALALASQAET